MDTQRKLLIVLAVLAVIAAVYYFAFGGIKNLTGESGQAKPEKIIPPPPDADHPSNPAYKAIGGGRGG